MHFKHILILIFSFRKCSEFKRDFICIEAGIIWNNTAVAAVPSKTALGRAPVAACNEFFKCETHSHTVWTFRAI